MQKCFAGVVDFETAQTEAQGHRTTPLRMTDAVVSHAGTGVTDTRTYMTMAEYNSCLENPWQTPTSLRGYIFIALAFDPQRPVAFEMHARIPM